MLKLKHALRPCDPYIAEQKPWAVVMPDACHILTNLQLTNYSRCITSRI